MAGDAIGRARKRYYVIIYVTVLARNRTTFFDFNTVVAVLLFVIIILVLLLIITITIDIYNVGRRSIQLSSSGNKKHTLRVNIIL